MQAIQEFLAQRRIAIVGISHNPKDFSRVLYREFRKRDFDVVAVNPNTHEVEGSRCYPRLQDVQPPVDAALVMTSPEKYDQVAQDCKAAGVRRVWIYRRAPEAVAYCQANGITAIAGECPLMFLPRAGWIHRLHGWLKGYRGEVISDISRTRQDSAPSGPSGSSGA
jgi:hypothetical protein